MSINYPPAESVKEAIKTLRDNNVKSFVLDLRNNRFGPAETRMYVDIFLLEFWHGYIWCSGGLFPEGIQIAKIW
jgi:hypothetical protein